MRPTTFLAVLALTALANALDAQSPPRAVGIDTTPAVLNLFLRARGDTLWTTFVADSRRVTATDSTAVVVFHGADAAMLIGGRQFALPPSLARIYRSFLAEARECQRPAPGCELDSELMRKLGQQ
jgi:hypothetical protein